MLAGTTQLVSQVMQRGACSGRCGGFVGAAEAIERVDIEMGFQEVNSVFGQERIAIVGEGVGEIFREIADLVIGDEEFGGGDAGDFVEQLGGIGKLGDDELAGGVIDGGEAVGFRGFREGGEVVRSLIIKQGEVVDGTCGEDAGDFTLDQLSGNGLGGLFGDGDPFPSFQ